MLMAALARVHRAFWQRRVIATALLLSLFALAAEGQVNVTTEHNDNFRSGQNVNETILTPANVNVSNFGRLFSDVVDGYIYAQPLYVPSVTIPGKGVHNVIYVVTEHDSVYAFDADSNDGGGLLWHTSFINPGDGITTISTQDVNCDAISPEIGVTSTPVIDVSTNTIYVLAETKEQGSFFHRLHALDITTGMEKNGGPVTITAQVAGTGQGSSGGFITFDPLMELNRPGLSLSQGNIYIAWSSNCDNPPFHGWVMGYDKTTLQPKGVWATTANGGFGGIWMSGGGIAADASGNLFIPTGNGTFDTAGLDPVDFGDSIVKLAGSANSFGPVDYFTPYDQGNLGDNDEDLGSGGALLLPDQPGAHVHELVQAGKEGSIYVVDRDHMGHFNPNNNSQTVQNIVGQVGGLFSTPAYWNGNVYFGGYLDALKAFSLTNGMLSAVPTSQSGVTFRFPGPTASVSANGNTNGIVWALQTDVTLNGGNEVLYAFDATNLGNELYDTTQNPTRDTVGGAVKFATPTIANGKVYVGAAQRLSVFGTISPTAAAPTFSPAWGTYTSRQTVSISDSTPGATIYYTTDGSNPTQSSPVYTNPITISVTTTVKAMASAPLLANSDIATAVYTITTGGGGSLNYGSGFTATGLTINGSGAINGSRLRLTDGRTGENTSVWSTTPVNIQTFTGDFNFQVTNPVGDGFTFTIQNAGTTAIGRGGAGLGYGAGSPGGSGGIPASLAVKFDLYSNFGEGPDSTGLYIDGASPTIPAVDMTNSGIDVHSGDIFNVHMTYDGTTLTITITDTVTYAAFSQSWPINIPSTVGSSTAYVGFTGASGGATAIQDILSWTFASQGPITTIHYIDGFTSDGLTLNGNAALNGNRLRLTDGGTGEVASAWYTAPLNIQSFTQEFTFQLTNARADGMTFAIQNAGLTATGRGGAGLGYGASSPGGLGGIAQSVAVKFDLFNNFGEGVDSTGLYINGASPTVPAIDMTGSGVNLHSEDVFDVWMTYDGTTLSMRITDLTTQATFQTSWIINIPSTVGGNTAYLGFTAGTGGAGATQDILSWVFTSQAAANYGNGFSSTGLSLSGWSTLNGSRLRLTDGGLGETSSAWYTTPLNVQAFTQVFSFQLTNPVADGITFALQNNSITQTGPGGGGLGYGAPNPGGQGGIPNSVAVKFDLYDNFGEGVDSTGLYVNGDSPTMPAVDMTSSGVDLHGGDVFNVRMTYDGTVLNMQITDAVTQATFQTSWNINIPMTINSNTAFAGFTGGTGGASATQEILSWIFLP